MTKFLCFDDMLININSIKWIKKHNEYPQSITGTHTHELFFIQVFLNTSDQPISKQYIANDVMNFEENEGFRDAEFEKIKAILVS